MAASISDTEMQRAKNQQRAELLMARESPQTVAGWIGRHLMMYKEYRDAKTISARIDAVTKEDILRLGNQIIQGPLTVAALGDVSHIQPYDALVTRLHG
jgi:predicted Zn-dependent peptidase